MTTAPPVRMRKRSWYLPSDVNDRLAAVVDDIHHATRRPKHEVLAAVIEAGVGHSADIMARFTAGGAE